MLVDNLTINSVLQSTTSQWTEKINVFVGLHKNVFCEVWKRSKLFCHGFGERYSLSPIRPVSLTCILCKKTDRIMEHLVSNNLFTNRQFGFLKGRSTVTQLLQILDDWTEALELQ